MTRLVYVSDTEPGILRRRSGKGFAYAGPDGRIGEEDRLRIRKLAVPPAYTDVWICARANGHLQATGRDARGRKQYRYHADWQSDRSETKFSQLTAFGAALPRLRRHLDRDLRDGPGGRDFTLAALVMLLDRAWLRIGNAGYAAENGSFGATTLRRRHMKLKDGLVQLDFTAKGGKRVRQVLRDRRLNSILHQIGDLPGRALFTYVDDAGAVRQVGSGDVNAYLAGILGEGVTAKTFRTWGGTLAALACAEAADPERSLPVKAVTQAAAEALHNTPAVCRKSYIHPAVLDLAGLDPQVRAQRLQGLDGHAVAGLRAQEARLLAFLERSG